MTFQPTSQSSSTGALNMLNIKVAAIITGLFVAAIWVIEAIDFILPTDLDQWGIHGWSIWGVFPGILLAPLLHVGFGHLLGNTLPIIVLGFLAAAKGLRPFFAATAIIMLVGGIGVWLTSPGTVTVGASGMIFGYFGYLVGRGIFHRSLSDFLIAVAVIIVYGSIIWGIFPTDPTISWQGHLFGLLGGLLAAWMLRRKGIKPAGAATG